MSWLLRSFIFILPFFVALSPALANEKTKPVPDYSWQSIGEKDGISVQKRQREGSDLISFRGQGWIEAPLIRVASVIFDQNRAKEWVANLAETRIIKWYSPTSYLEYDHMLTPPLVHDRDFISKVQITAIPKAHKISFVYQDLTPEELAKEVPTELQNTGYVRGLLSGTKLSLTGSADGKRTFVEGEINGDPKGSIPNWMINMAQRDWPTDTFRSLREQIAKDDVEDSPKILELLKPKKKNVKRKSKKVSK